MEDDGLDRVCVPMSWSGAGASVSAVVTTESFPPAVAAIGRACAVKAWQGPREAADAARGFAEALSFAPSCDEAFEFKFLHADDTRVVVADGAARGSIYVWDASTWALMQVLDLASDGDAPEEEREAQQDAPPASVTALAFNGTYLAVGTSRGEVIVWKQARWGGPLPPQDGEPLVKYVRLLQPLRVDPGRLPVETVLIGAAEGADPNLVAYSQSKTSFVVWKLADGRFMHAWGADGVVGTTPLRLCSMGDGLTVALHWEGPGHEPILTCADFATGSGGRLPTDSLGLTSEGEPLSLSFSQGLAVVGFSGGAVCAWDAQKQWKSWRVRHAGAVGAVQVVPSETGTEQRVLSGGADCFVRLWSATGEPLAAMEMGAQVTALHCPRARVAGVGTSRGIVELLALPAEGFEPSGPVELASDGDEPVQYSLYFDTGDGKGVTRAADRPDVFAAFAGTKSLVSRQEAAEEIAADAAKKPKPKSQDDAAATMAKGMTKGGLSEEDQEEIDSKARAAAMDAAGVARDAAVPTGPRKCGNANCREREIEGVRKFLRCGRCKMAFYCSAHCQRTHWRDGHKAECGTKAAVCEPVPAPPIVMKDDFTDRNGNGVEAKAPAPAPAPTPPSPAPTPPPPAAAAPEPEGPDSDDDDDDGLDELDELD